MLVSITRLRVRKWRYLPAFFFYSLRSARQAQAADGNLAVTLLRDSHNTYWTRTLWTTEQSMKAFMLSGVHRKVMPRLMDWCDEASVVHWSQEGADAPSWPEAHKRLESDGRRSKVHHPTEAHQALRFSAPRVTATSETRLK